MTIWGKKSPGKCREREYAWPLGRTGSSRWCWGTVSDQGLDHLVSLVSLLTVKDIYSNCEGTSSQDDGQKDKSDLTYAFKAGHCLLYGEYKELVWVQRNCF